MIKKTTNLKVTLPFRYAGGKYYALKYLRPFWENIDHDEYREPFLGGGAVFWAKQKSKFNWLNDIDQDLMFTLKYIKEKSNAEKLVALFANEIEATKTKHLQVKNMQPKNNLEKAYKYYYLNRTSFSGKMNNPTWGYRPKRSLPPFRWKERIFPCSLKLQNVDLTALDFEKVITEKPKGKSVLMYLDPPYFNPKPGSHYKHSFTTNNHLRLAKLLKRTKYNFFLTYDNSADIRNLYEWAHIYELSFFYRVGNSRNQGNKRRMSEEIVITNYEL